MTGAGPAGPSTVDIMFAPVERWGWRFSPPRPPAISLERNEPPAPQPGEELAATWRRWRRRIEDHEAFERARAATEPWWHTARPQQPWTVVPIFGGTRVGWEALLTTLGTSLLAEGHRLTIVNLSEWDVAATLTRLAELRGVAVSQAAISAQQSSVDLFEALSAEDLISLVLNALATEDPTARRREHMEDRALLRAIAVHLKPGVTLGRLRSALRILIREAPLTDDDAQLSNAEFDALTEMFGQEVRTGTDLLGRSYQLEHALEELSFFAQLPLTRESSAFESPSADPQDTSPGQARGHVPQLLRVEVDRDLDPHEHDLGADLLVQRLLRQLTDKNRVSGTDEALVVAGADRLNPRTLDRLVTLAESRRLRVVLMFARLRDQALSALGASDTCVFMRLSDYREATHAAEQVGRNHTFVLSTTTQTRGSAYDQGTNRGTSHERGSSTSSTFGAQFSASRSQNVGESASQGSSTSQNISISDSESYQRVYEFALEPRTVQGLPETALFLVEQAHGTTTIADCDPTIALHPKLG